MKKIILGFLFFSSLAFAQANDQALSKQFDGAWFPPHANEPNYHLILYCSDNMQDNSHALSSAKSAADVFKVMKVVMKDAPEADLSADKITDKGHVLHQKRGFENSSYVSTNPVYDPVGITSVQGRIGADQKYKLIRYDAHTGEYLVENDYDVMAYLNKQKMTKPRAIKRCISKQKFVDVLKTFGCSEQESGSVVNAASGNAPKGYEYTKLCGGSGSGSVGSGGGVQTSPGHE